MAVKQLSRQTWLFEPGVTIAGGAAAGGPKEGQGPLKDDFDQVLSDLRLGQSSFEQAEQVLQSGVLRRALAKAGLAPEDVDILFAGDLIDQITPSCFSARELGAPFCGLFSACATFAEALSLAALTIASGAARTSMAMSSSHTCTAERQFRFPNEYGSQKPPYSQTTVTAAGALLLTAEPGPLVISAATIGKVRDNKVTDPFKLGAAMAPACADTIAVHLSDMQRTADDYDLICSGDLGREGGAILRELLSLQGVELDESRYIDCGLLLSGDAAGYFAGGSGCGCTAAAIAGHVLRRLSRGELQRVLLVGTGALLSALSVQQKESIPAIAHALVLEGGGSCG